MIHDIARDWSSVQIEFPKLDYEACVRDMHVIDFRGTVHTGFYAYRSLAWVLPAAWILLPLLYVPPVPWIGGALYRFIADQRSTSCKQR